MTGKDWALRIESMRRSRGDLLSVLGKFATFVGNTWQVVS